MVWVRGAAELVAAVDQHAQHDQVVVDLDPDQARCSQRHLGDRVRIDRVGFAAVAGGEHSGLRRELGRHVDHGLPVVDQPVGEVLADAVAALDRPQPIRIPAARLEHRGVPALVRAVPADRQHVAAVVDHLDRGRTLVWIHSDDHAHPGTSRSLVRSLR
jgi:hypothetical protein